MVYRRTVSTAYSSVYGLQAYREYHLLVPDLSAARPTDRPRSVAVRHLCIDDHRSVVYEQHLRRRLVRHRREFPQRFLNTISCAFYSHSSAVYREGPETFISHATASCHVTVCAQMAASMEAAILPV